MSTAMVTGKVPAATRDRLAELAARQGKTLGAVFAELVEREQRRAMLNDYNAAMARLRSDPEAWADYQAELQTMEGTLMDGLEDDPWHE